MIQKISMRRVALFALVLLFTIHLASACTESTTMMPTMISTITYPETKRVDVVEEHFGQTIVDPYCWLENDVRNKKKVAAWVASHKDQLNTDLLEFIKD